MKKTNHQPHTEKPDSSITLFCCSHRNSYIFKNKSTSFKYHYVQVRWGLMLSLSWNKMLSKRETRDDPVEILVFSPASGHATSFSVCVPRHKVRSSLWKGRFLQAGVLTSSRRDPPCTKDATSDCPVFFQFLMWENSQKVMH